MTFPYHAVRELRFTFCVHNIFPVFSKSCVKVSVCSSYIKFVVAGACHCLTFLFCLKIYYSYCYLFCRLLLSIFLLIHWPVRECYPFDCFCFFLFFHSALVLFCLNLCLLISLCVVFKFNLFLIIIYPMNFSSFL